MSAGAAARAGRHDAASVGAIVASSLAFGAMAVFARYAYADGVDTSTLLALRFSIAGVLLAVLMRVQRLPWPTGRMLGAALAMGAIGYAGQAFTFFTALTLIPAGLVALLLYLLL